MGAITFEDSIFAVTAEDAYHALTEQAIYDYGHDPYSGTIATTEGFVMKPFAPRETYVEWRTRMLDNENLNKWGPCACAADPDEPVKDGQTLWHFAGWAAC